MLPLGLKMTLAPVVWRLYRSGLRVPETDRDQSSAPVIFACLHRDILPAIVHVRPVRPVLLVSQSPDGEILIRTLGQDDYSYVRGATGEDGRRAFVALRRELAAGRSIGVAVDGPKGPFGVINEGVLQLSRLAGVPIVPLLAAAKRPIILGTWDRTVVPRPFSRVLMETGHELTVPRQATEADLQAVREKLAGFFGVDAEDHADT